MKLLLLLISLFIFLGSNAQKKGTIKIDLGNNAYIKAKVNKNYYLDWELYVDGKLTLKGDFLHPYMKEFGYCHVSINFEHYCLIGRGGKILAEYPWMTGPESTTGNFVVSKVTKNYKFGMIDSTGKVILDFTYDRIDKFYDGRARVRLNGKYGFINTTGKVVIPIMYADAYEYFSQNKNEVSDGKFFFKIDTTGKCVENCDTNRAKQRIGPSTAYVIFPSKLEFTQGTGPRINEYTATYSDSYSSAKLAWVYTHNAKEEDLKVEELFASITMTNIAKSVNAEIIVDTTFYNALCNGVQSSEIYQIWKVNGTYYKAISYITTKGRILLLASNISNDFTSWRFERLFEGFYFK